MSSTDRVGIGVVGGGSLVALLTLSTALLLAQTPPAQTPPAPAQNQPAQTPAAPAPGAPAAAPPTAGVIGAITGTPAHDTAKGVALLAETRKALGGEDKFKAVQRLEVKGKSARALGNNNIQGDFEYQLQLPDKFRRKEVLGFSGGGDRGGGGVDVVQILNGASVVQRAEFQQQSSLGGFEDGGGNRGGRGRGNMNLAALLGGPNTEGLDAQTKQDVEHKAVASEMARMLIAFLVTTTEPIAWIGIAESPEGKADVLEFNTPDGAATRVMIDDKNHTPLLLSWTGIASQLGNFNRGGANRGGNRGAAGGQQQGNRGGNRGGAGQVAPLQMYLSDYKSVNGIKLPHLIQSGSNGETTEELVVKSYRINPTFKADLFDK
ncbi:MAG TPA: hypothetical protein VFV95_11670 [Vicinamibacterales bacterium]|nr:hypothetical protein [Vicinamibacterales bacterium]